MSASAYLRRVSARVVDALLADPSRLRNVLFPSSTETVIDDEVLFTLEQWQALGVDFVWKGGTPIGTETIGDGPARGFTVPEVRTIAAKLAIVDTSALGTDARADLGALREFVVETAKAEASLIVYLG